MVPTTDHASHFDVSHVVNKPLSSTGGREEMEDHTRKKKTPTQLRRERKKRQRERERRQREMERNRQQQAGGRRGNHGGGSTRVPLCSLNDSGIATSGSSSSLEEGSPRRGTTKTTSTAPSPRPPQQLRYRHSKPILLERPHPTRDRVATGSKQLPRSRERATPTIKHTSATPTNK